MGVFSDYEQKVYPHRWQATLRVGEIHGGTPTDPKKAEGWIRAKMGEQADEAVRRLVVDTMAERGVTADEAVSDVMDHHSLNGFKRDPSTGEPYLEGRCVKAMLKEAANIAWPKRRWGESKKGTRSYFAEHVFVPEEHIPFGVAEPTGIDQRFVHTFRGSGIQYEEYVDNALLTFTVEADAEISHDDWAALWLRAQRNGLGASRSQGYGKFEVVGWEKIA